MCWIRFKWAQFYPQRHIRTKYLRNLRSSVLFTCTDIQIRRISLVQCRRQCLSPCFISPFGQNHEVTVQSLPFTCEDQHKQELGETEIQVSYANNPQDCIAKDEMAPTKSDIENAAVILISLSSLNK